MTYLHNLTELFVEVTNRCLLNCTHCSSCAGPFDQQLIPSTKVLSMIKEAKELGLESLTISGGEPLLHPELFGLLTYATNNNLKVCLYTCGVIEYNNNLVSLSDEVINKIFDSNISKLIFSLQGGNSKAHDQVTGVMGSFDLTTQSIAKAIKKGLPVELHFVPMRINYSEIESVVQIAQQLGVKRVSLLRLVLQGRCEANEKLLLSSVECSEIVQKVDSLRSKYPNVLIRLGAPFDCLTYAGIGCSASKNKLLISALGEAFPCEAFKFLKGQRPSIYESSIRRIWENDSLLNELRNLDYVENCSSCQRYDACRGGCPGERMLINGSIGKGPDPLCLIAL